MFWWLCHTLSHSTYADAHYTVAGGCGPSTQNMQHGLIPGPSSGGVRTPRTASRGASMAKDILMGVLISSSWG
eukprot:342932-Alexandrium_andersonii.AAC.1